MYKTIQSFNIILSLRHASNQTSAASLKGMGYLSVQNLSLYCVHLAQSSEEVKRWIIARMVNVSALKSVEHMIVTKSS